MSELDWRGREQTPLRRLPGMLRQVLFRLFVGDKPYRSKASLVEQEVVDGTVLRFAGGVRLLMCPGHCAGK